MTAGAVPSFDHDDVGVGVFDQAVDERHAHRPGTDDEVVGLELTMLDHALTLTAFDRSVGGTGRGADGDDPEALRLRDP